MRLRWDPAPAAKGHPRSQAQTSQDHSERTPRDALAAGDDDSVQGAAGMLPPGRRPHEVDWGVLMKPLDVFEITAEHVVNVRDRKSVV